MDIGADTDSEYDSEEKEFWFVFPFIGKMAAYFQWHYDKRSQRTSILSGSDYMAEVRDGNPTNCHDMFRMTLDLFYHLVDELKHYEYLKEGKGCVDVQETVAIFLYIVGHNTRMRPMADRFQHSTETVDRKFRRVLQAVHTYGQHLIKPDPNVVGLPENLRGNNKDVLFNTWENLDVERDDMQTRNNGNSLESSVSAKRRHVREMSNVSKRAMGEFKNDMTDHMWEEYV
ncbi:hypothetical protein CFP56_019534 [Quercus suber]|uniref:DUF8040 domain-containing protein n=1 Tax=Quercus suber TaxID=58331 RepID=A0AAW0KJ46_QUESU